jgi:hypothetical protein
MCGCGYGWVSECKVWPYCVNVSECENIGLNPEPVSSMLAHIPVVFASR